MTHRQIRELIPLLAIGRLEGEEKEEVLRHLETCGECRRLYERERRLATLMEEMAREVVPPPPPTVKRGFPYLRFAVAFASITALLLLAVFFVRMPLGGNKEVEETPTVEVSGLEDLWDGYILVQGDGNLEVRVSIDGKVVAVGRGEGYVYLEPEVEEGEHYVKVEVLTGRDTLKVDRVVLYDPETYAMATGGE